MVPDFKIGEARAIATVQTREFAIRIAKRKLCPHRCLRAGDREIGDGARQIRRIENWMWSSGDSQSLSASL
jgi:hypothetical protein